METTESPVLPIDRADSSDVRFPHDDGSRVPYKVFSSQAVYDREQERIFRGPTWNFVALEAEIPKPGDFKSTFVGDTPVVVTRGEDGALAAWVNRCAHRGAQVCRQARGNASSHTCVYHQWSFDSCGNLLGVPFRRGQKGMTGMPADFDPKNHGLRKLRVDSYKGLVFATFSDDVAPLPDYLGPQMRPWIDRIFHKPIEYLGCTRQYSKSNWKLYFENVKDPYHASMLHLFHTTFNIFRVGMKARSIPDATHGLHSIITMTKTREDTDTASAYRQQNIRSFDEGFSLEDDSILGLVSEYDEDTTNHIQPIFPQLVIQQIHNTLVARQLLPKGPKNFELIFHFFGYADDTPELRDLRIKQANLVGPAGYISMEDTEATELVQRGTARDADAASVIEMSRGNPDQQDTAITESLIRKFWVGYQKLMGY
ncbi:anthranilate 1,2-dioxygenase large subunit AndAc [Burkholderia thailandensis]|uniref:Ortho-halobenzoate 1,2-dioxygenase alpha-ISP protein OhbB n=1 Tax=Burkholderia thailandensis (strain ATCC 700388 / DSM 13276 / CCUG 48851 / CIP 106301 / E264) TaxID=271848 RepID=Q2T811_BURTA|nr:anthranilate 1,2-dioxygenase large subunit AndAc [Burkholderia thailandensis]ABC35661.1 ortho-halobenzoate 1,2-dioxygenase alpha-ISP protein OhbB [Burkholderia thailandensis E264]AHI75950.1 ring hydroxylating alpha subunit family protein [Burkholderia thailandensis 2002721723]AHI82210.1 ring hydroxylating alpha subunit family protein [Burkholderia thailandensis E444]AIC89066.1 ring hydroxylating alpha subunit family protein [Burkholderia thailandensis USAMRU Malaysia \